MREAAFRNIPRHNLKVPELAIPAYSAHMQKTEALNRLVRIRVARTIVPARNCVWRELNHTKWRCRARKGLAKAVRRLIAAHLHFALRICHRANYRVNIVHERTIPRPKGTRRNGTNCRDAPRKASCSFHIHTIMGEPTLSFIMKFLPCPPKSRIICFIKPT